MDTTTHGENTPMETVVTLRTGVESTESTVNTMMYVLRALFTDDPIGFYELVQICRNPQHNLFGTYRARLEDRELLEPNGQPHALIRDIVQAAVVGNDFEDIRLEWPVARPA